MVASGDQLPEQGEVDPAFVDRIVGEVEARLPADRGISEIIPPSHEPIFRKVQPTTIDGEALQNHCDTAMEVVKKPSVSGGTTDTQSKYKTAPRPQKS
jgi:hypothetical protein